MTYQAFVSYVHADNDNDRNRIVRLAQDVAAEFAMISGGVDELRVVLDKRILAGSYWSDELDEMIAKSNFFLAVITPRYFKSTVCRQELSMFYDAAKSLDRLQLIIPIYYLDVPGLETETADRVKCLVNQIQWYNWRPVRLQDIDSAIYRETVHGLAVQIREPIDALPDPSEEVQRGAQTAVSPGTHPLDGVISAVQRFSEAIRAVSETFRRRLDEVAPIENGVRDGLAVIRAVKSAAVDLDDVATEMTMIVSDYNAAVEAADGHVMRLLSVDPRSEPLAREYATEILGAAQSAESTIASMEQVWSLFRPFEVFSSNARQVFDRIQQASLSLSDTLPTVVRWGAEAQQLLDGEG